MDNNALQQVIVAPSLSKATQGMVANDLVAKVVNGEIDPMQAFIQIKAIAEVCDLFLKNENIVSATQSAVSRYGKDVPTFSGAKVTLASTSRYDYESSQDPEYHALLEQKEQISAKIKAREMFLKTIDDSIDVVDKETGAVQTIFAPSKKQSHTLRVTFAK